MNVKGLGFFGTQSVKVGINAIRASLRSSNPGALAQSKFQFVNGSGYKRSGRSKRIVEDAIEHFTR